MWTRMSKQSSQQHRRRPTAKRRARRQAFWTAGAMLIVFLFCLPLLPKFFLQESIPTAEPVSTESSSAGSATVSQLEEAEPAPEPEPQPLVQTVRFSATGDNLIHAPIYKQAQRRGHPGRDRRQQREDQLGFCQADANGDPCRAQRAPGRIGKAAAGLAPAPLRRSARA